jgi:exodeoxyribonuclease VII small subunit
MAGKKEKFSEYFKIVQEVVRKLESGQLDLDDALEEYERGVAALKKCYEILKASEQKINLLKKEVDSLSLTDFTRKEETPSDEF